MISDEKKCMLEMVLSIIWKETQQITFPIEFANVLSNMNFIWSNLGYSVMIDYSNLLCYPTHAETIELNFFFPLNCDCRSLWFEHIFCLKEMWEGKLVERFHVFLIQILI